jgi:hypothetical protein
MKKCCYCENKATWLLMSGNDITKDLFCDKCVPKGCSCNSEYFDREEDALLREKQIDHFLRYRNLKVLNFGSEIHNHGDHLEEITDINLIKSMFYNFTSEQLFHLEIIPLDENKEEYPCCEFMYKEEGYLEEDFD